MAEELSVEQPTEQPAEQPRNEDGRFVAALRERVDTEDLKNRMLIDSAMEAGLIEPTDDMDPKIWKRAFEARQSRADGVDSLPVEPGTGERAAQTSEPESEAGQHDRMILDAYHERRETFKAEHPDFDDVVGSLELPEKISNAVQLAIIEDDHGPEVAYFLGQHPEVREKLGEMSAARAGSEIGKIAERLAQQDQAYDASAREYLSVDIPSHVVTEYQRKLAQQESLSEEEIGIAQAIAVAPHVSRTIVAMGRPDVALHLLRNIELVGKLNNMHPMVAAGELAQIKRELDRESTQAERPRLPSPITPTRKSSSTDSALSDSLPAEEWARRFRKKMKYTEA